MFGSSCLHAIAQAPALTFEQKEQFLGKARIVQTKPVSRGIAHTVRVSLSDGKVTHDASVQRIDEAKPIFHPDSGGPPELDFRDTFKFNIAAWKLAGLLGLSDMIPPSVERKYEGTPAAFTWWIEDVIMDEEERRSQKMRAPNQDTWTREWDVLIVFDQLISNSDRNVGNVQIDKDWRVWMIDHTRAFRRQKELLNATLLARCDRNLLAKMKGLDEDRLQKEIGRYVSHEEIRGLLARRDLIVKFFDAKGERALFDRPSRK